MDFNNLPRTQQVNPLALAPLHVLESNTKLLESFTPADNIPEISARFNMLSRTEKIDVIVNEFRYVLQYMTMSVERPDVTKFAIKVFDETWGEMTGDTYDEFHRNTFTKFEEHEILRQYKVHVTRSIKDLEGHGKTEILTQLANDENEIEKK